MSIIEPGAYVSNVASSSFGVSRGGGVRNGHPVDAGSPVPQAGNDVVTTTGRSRNDLARLQGINDRQNRVAAQIRSDDRHLHQADRLLGQMKRILQITKMYPPYPPGETERTKFLRSFNGLRQQIERLMILPEEKWTGRMPGDPLAHQTSQAGSPSSSAAAAIVPDAATTFGIPELPDTADDVPLERSLTLIDNAQAAIASRRATIAEQAMSINQSVGYGAKAEELNRASREPWDLALPPEDEADQMSTEAGSGLEQAQGNGITEADMQPLLRKLAG